MTTPPRVGYRLFICLGDMSVSTLNFSKVFFFFFTNCKTNIHFCNRLLTSLPGCNFNFFVDLELTFLYLIKLYKKAVLVSSINDMEQKANY